MNGPVPNSSGSLSEFNPCHAPDSGVFCSGADSGHGSMQERKQKFFDALQASGAYGNPMNNREIVLGNEAGAELYGVAEGIRLSAVRSFKFKSGAGGRAMAQIIAAADKTGITLFGTASPFGKGGMNRKQLIEWYKRLGFTAKGADITRVPRR